MISNKEYKISVDHDDWVAPEETLLDSGSGHSDLETPISAVAFKFIFLGFLALTLILFSFTFKVGVVNHSSFALLALQNKTVNFSIPPPRGIIFDRAGKPLAENLASFDLLVVSKEVRSSQGDLDPNIKKVAEILKINPDEFQNLISEQTKSNSVFFAAEDLNKSQMIEIEYLKPKGFYVITNTKRSYIDGSQFSQVVGYTSKVSKDDLYDTYYTPVDSIGRSGIEVEYERYLRGEHGLVFFGEETGSSQKDAVAGQNVVLNIDYELQKKLYSTLYSILSASGLKKAAAVVQNPQNGEILAMVSLPSFDNNIFSSNLSESDFKNLFENKNKSLFNRVISGLYNPGSTIKPFMGLMTLEENIFKPEDTIKDCVSLTIPNPKNPNSPYVFKNWRQDFGLFNLRRAIANSCNIYFATAGGGYGNIKGLGVEKIAKYLNSALANSLLKIDLPGEQNGFVPTPEWKQEQKGESWYQGDTYNISIGQGDLLVTPLWLNTYISAIANGGAIYKPQVASRIVDDKKNDVKIFKPEILAKLSFKDSVIKEIKSDMEETVISGTAKMLQDLPIRAGAKTGTAEVVKGQKTNSLFVAFAPFDNPEISITVLVESVTTSEALAIRTANEFLKWYFQRNMTPEPSTIIPEPVVSPSGSAE